MPCYHPKWAWLPPEPLPEDIYVSSKTGKAIHASRRLVFREPVGAYRQREYRMVPIGCGRCMGCKERDSRDLAIRLTCEAKMHRQSSFITLTYDDQHMPWDRSVSKPEMQEWMQRMRNHFRLDEVLLRYFLVGEYGSRTWRAHYHACLFGTGFLEDRRYVGKSATGHPLYESRTLDELWGKGRATVQELTVETAAYCARYTNKKIEADAPRRRLLLLDGREVELAPEFRLMSRRPGLGAAWFDKFHSDIYGAAEGAYVSPGGHRVVAPRYFDRKLEERDPARYEQIREKRLQACNTLQAIQEGAPSRLAVREDVELARQGSQRRKRDAV